MSHSDDVGDAVAKMLALGTAGAAAGQKPPPAPQVAGEPPVQALMAPSGPEKEAKPAVPPQRPRTPRAKPPKAPKQTKAAADDESPSNGKIRFTVAMDSDLIDLMSLARPALGGLKIAQLFFTAARQYASMAAELPDTPLAETVLDARYDDVVVEAAHRTPLAGYVTRRGYEALAEDAAAAGLDHSEFVRRTVRRVITVDHAFVPTSKAHLLEQPSAPCDAIMEELKTQMKGGRPAAVLPPPGNLVWAAVKLKEGTPLRALTDVALATMPGCTSATQALLTVL